MTFNIILLVIFTPWFLLNAFGRLVASGHFAVRAGLAEPKVKPISVLIPFLVILFALWRIYG